MGDSTQEASLQKRPRVGVVLGSGGIKAFAAIPLFEFLDELQIDIDLLVGCSGGSLMCAGRAAGYSPAEMQELLAQHSGRKYTSQVDYRAILGIAHPRLGQVGRAPAILKPQSIQQLFHRLFENLRVEELNPKTRLQATDLQTGEAVLLSSGPVADAVYASIACFPLLPPIRIEGRWLMDGAFSSPLPVMEAVKRGMDLIIALDFAEQFTTEPKGFLDFFNRSVNATSRALTRSQMALSIDLHHYEIVMIKIQFDKAIQLWDMGQMPFILESGRKAIGERKKDILVAIESFSKLDRNASAEFL